MADGFSLGGGSVSAGQITIDVVTRLDNAITDLNNLQRTVKNTVTEIKTDTKTSSESFSGFAVSVVSSLLTIQTAIKITRTIWEEFKNDAAEQTSINRVLVSMHNIGISTTGVRDSLISLGYQFKKFGIDEREAYEGYQKLIQATKDTQQTQRFLQIALDFSIVQGESLSSVIEAVTMAHSGQIKTLDTLLIKHGYAAKGVKNFTEALELLKKGGKGASDVLSEQSKVINQIAIERKIAIEELNKSLSGPIIEIANTITTLISAITDLPKNFRALYDYISGAQEKLKTYQTASTTFGSGTSTLPGSAPSGLKGKAIGYWFKYGKVPTEDDLRRERNYQNTQDAIPPVSNIPEMFKNRKYKGNIKGVRTSKNPLTIYEGEWNDELEQQRMFWENLGEYAKGFSETMSNSIADALIDMKLNLQSFADFFKSAMKRALSALLNDYLTKGIMQLLSLIQRSISGVPVTGGTEWSGGDASDIPSNTTSFGGVRPITTGNTMINISTSSSNNLLLDVWHGSNLTSRKQFGKAVILEGGKFITRT